LGEVQVAGYAYLLRTTHPLHELATAMKSMTVDGILTIQRHLIQPARILRSQHWAFKCGKSRDTHAALGAFLPRNK
jgi:hypothetical protein